MKTATKARTGSVRRPGKAQTSRQAVRKSSGTSVGKARKREPEPEPERAPDGRFVVASPRADDDEREAIREGRRLVRFRDVIEAVAGLPGADSALESVRAKLLFTGNPSVRVKVKRTAEADALGLGPSVSKRIRAETILARATGLR